MATIVGIVRRPYPTASDQRLAVTPRSPADLRILGAPASGDSGGRAASGGSAESAAAARAFASSGPADPDGTVDADLVDLVAFTGRIVRVGGLVVDLRPDGFLLDDGTTIGLVLVRGAAADLLSLLEPEDAINATGVVERVADGLAVVIEDPGGIIQAGDPVATGLGNGAAPSDTSGDAGSAGAAAISPEPAGRQARRADLFDGFASPGAGFAGIGTLLALSGASLLITLGRRARARRRLAARVAARVAAFGAAADGSGTPAIGPRSAERDSSTIHAA
jgi:hypothetical protein